MRISDGFVPCMGSMVVVSGLFTARGVTAIAEARASAWLTSPPPMAAPSAASSAPRPDATPLVEHNPFESARPTLAPGPGPPREGERCEGVHLHAIVLSTDEAWSFASLTEGEGPSILRRRGDPIGARVVRFIGRDHVVLEGERGSCDVPMYVFASDGVGPTPPLPQHGAATPKVTGDLDETIARGIADLGPTERAVDRAVLERIFERQAELLGSTRLSPVKEGDRILGMKIAVAPPLLARLGFANGDTLVSIGGYSVTDPEKMLLAYSLLRTAARVEVEIVRAGRPTRLSFEIR